MRSCKIRDSLYTLYEDGSIISHKGRNINTWKENNTGYHLFRTRYSDGTVKCLRLHRILAECFIPNPDNLPFVKHKDDNKDNNSLDNLEWGANPDNVKEGYDNDCYQYRERCHKIRVTVKDSGEYLYFKSLRTLAEELKVNRKNVAAYLKGKKKNTYTEYEFEYWEM